MLNRIGAALFVLMALACVSPAWAGKAGFEFPVNTYTEGNQFYPAVAGLSDGGFVIVWEAPTHEQDDYKPGIYGQRFSAHGALVGSEFHVNTSRNYYLTNPSVAGLSGGGFVVTWTSSSSQDVGKVYGQVYSDTGAPVGAEFRVSHKANSHGGSSVAGLGDGGFVVAWYFEVEFTDTDIHAQRFSATGGRLGGEFRVNSYRPNIQGQVSAAGLGDGGFVIAWTSSDGQDGSGRGVYAQRYDAEGARVGKEFRVNTYKTGDQSNPSVAALRNGGFVIAWISLLQDGSSYGIYAQRYSATGVPAGKEFRVNSYTADAQLFPSVAGLTDGGFIVTWSSNGQDGSGRGIFGKRYDAAGTKVGGEFQVNTYTTDSQDVPSVAPLDDGGFVVAWQSFGQDDASSYGVYGQRFRP